MPDDTKVAHIARSADTRAAIELSAVLALTSLHHVYGAIRYATPWRYHAVFLSAGLCVVLLGAYWFGRMKSAGVVGGLARWVFYAVGLLGPVLLIGGYEGLYNHVLKDVLYFAGLPEVSMRMLFPPPRYEMPNDLFFEATGILQTLPAGMVAYHLTVSSSNRLRRPAFL